MQGNMLKLGRECRYDHVTKSVGTSQEGIITTLWNQQVRTDRFVANNKPDFKIRDNEKGTCMLTFWRRNYFFNFSTSCI